MKIDGALTFAGPGHAGEAAARLEEQGFDGALSFEGPHEPFMPLALAAHETSRIQLMTAVAIAFARNPMVCAYAANDLQLISEGRFILGLGSQIRPHIERRFSAVWSRPADRMREMVLAIRAIWDTWENGTPLDFRGEFYTHTLMTPVFNPGPNPHGRNGYGTEDVQREPPYPQSAAGCLEVEVLDRPGQQRQRRRTVLDLGIPVAAGAVGGQEGQVLAVGNGLPTEQTIDHATGPVASNAGSGSTSSNASGQPGYGGGEPPKAGRWAWGAHELPNRGGRGRKSPVAPADWMARQIAINVFSNRSSSSWSGV